MDSSLLHALDLCALGDWEGAKRALLESTDPAAPRLASLIVELQERDDERLQAQAVGRHEIGNALSVALANVEGVVDGVLEATPARLTGIRDALQTAASLLNDENKDQRDTHAAAANTIRIEVFNICESISAQVAMLRGIAEAKSVQVVFDPCGKQLPACFNFRGDPDCVGQVLRNVLLNAVRYTPPGGSIEVQCGSPEGRLTLTVRDTGPGISRQDVPHIFDRGYRGTNAQTIAGGGIGLSVVSSLLGAMGGEVKVLSESERGATFEVKIPAVALRD